MKIVEKTTYEAPQITVMLITEDAITYSETGNTSWEGPIVQ